MSDNELRDRIAATLYCHRYPREPMWGALAMAQGEGMDAERGQTNCVQRIYVPMAQAIIDDLALTVHGDDCGYHEIHGSYDTRLEDEQ